MQEGTTDTEELALGSPHIQNTSMIRLRINDVSYSQVLLDSGAVVSAISESYAKQLGAHLQPLDPGDFYTLISANSSKVSIIAKTTLSLSLEANSNKIYHTFFVI